MAYGVYTIPDIHKDRSIQRNTATVAYGVYTIPDIHKDRSIQRSFT